MESRGGLISNILLILGGGLGIIGVGCYGIHTWQTYSNIQ